MALPVYVLVPPFYATTTGLALSTIGAVLLATRVLDAFVDPLLGAWVDRSRGLYLRPLLIAAPVLAAGYVLLFSPLEDMPPGGAAAWLTAHADRRHARLLACLDRVPGVGRAARGRRQRPRPRDRVARRLRARRRDPRVAAVDVGIARADRALPRHAGGRAGGAGEARAAPAGRRGVRASLAVARHRRAAVRARIPVAARDLRGQRDRGRRARVARAVLRRRPAADGAAVRRAARAVLRRGGLQHADVGAARAPLGPARDLARRHGARDRHVRLGIRRSARATSSPSRSSARCPASASGPISRCRRRCSRA